jgi:hypothetical protein
MRRPSSSSRAATAAALIAAASLAAAGAAVAAARGAHHVAGPGIAIAGRPQGRLAPGRALPIDLRLTDRRPFAIRVTRLTVSVRSVTPRPGCAARRNFRALQFRGRHPLVLRPGRPRTLAQLGYPVAAWPRVQMLDTSFDQTACARVKVALAYTATGRRAR